MPDYLPFAKMQGIGNDFVVIDGRRKGHLDWSVLAIELCDRKTGVGADGLLVIDNTQLADFMMRMYNPDGTPDVCGNGLRCIARYAVENGIVDTEAFRIGTLAGVRDALVGRDAGGRIERVTVEMGVPRFRPDEIPMRIARPDALNYALALEDEPPLIISALSTGTTHAVTFVDALPDDDTFYRVSPRVENHALFPERSSVMWCRVDSDNSLRMRIWERGAGETLGCGTGACAAAVAAILEKRIADDNPIDVISGGGTLRVSWQPGRQITMAGPAEFVYSGTYRLDPARPFG